MLTFMVKHELLCVVSAWRYVEADSFEDALEKVKNIETVTCSGDGDHEIIEDRQILSLEVIALDRKQP